jgi:hypothetical protein
VAAAAAAEAADGGGGQAVGFGRVVALQNRSSTLRLMCSENRCLYFLSGSAAEP